MPSWQGLVVVRDPTFSFTTSREPQHHTFDPPHKIKEKCLVEDLPRTSSQHEIDGELRSHTDGKLTQCTLTLSFYNIGDDYSSV